MLIFGPTEKLKKKVNLITPGPKDTKVDAQITETVIRESGYKISKSTLSKICLLVFLRDMRGKHSL